MSILIKGMEMPVTCCHCPLMGYDPEIEWNDGGRDAQGAYICVITHELIDNTKREDHCPLVPVPPHGRLIDADAAIEDIRDEILERQMDGMKGTPLYIEDLRQMWQRLEDEDLVPTVIEAEDEHTMEEYMYGQEGNPNDGSM